MSWIERELQRRAKREAQRVGANALPPDAAEGGVDTLWAAFEHANEQLPDGLRLPRHAAADAMLDAEHAIFSVLLLAENGAGIGFTGDAVRYFWPKKSLKRSHNFWIRWQPGSGYRVSRRTLTSWSGPGIDEAAFKESRVDHILKCLVTQRRVTFRSVRVLRFGMF